MGSVVASHARRSTAMTGVSIGGEPRGDGGVLRGERRTARQSVDEAQTKRVLQCGDAPADADVIDARLSCRHRRQRADERQREKIAQVPPVAYR